MFAQTKKTLGRIITLSLMTATMMNANNVNNPMIIENNPQIKADTNNPYYSMSTIQLQEEVQKRSENGDLPFDMGIELIRRWTKG